MVAMFVCVYYMCMYAYVCVFRVPSHFAFTQHFHFTILRLLYNRLLSCCYYARLSVHSPHSFYPRSLLVLQALVLPPVSLISAAWADEFYGGLLDPMLASWSGPKVSMM